MEDAAGWVSPDLIEIRISGSEAAVLAISPAHHHPQPPFKAAALHRSNTEPLPQTPTASTEQPARAGGGGGLIRVMVEKIAGGRWE